MSEGWRLLKKVSSRTVIFHTCCLCRQRNHWSPEYNVIASDVMKVSLFTHFLCVWWSVVWDRCKRKTVSSEAPPTSRWWTYRSGSVFIDPVVLLRLWWNGCVGVINCSIHRWFRLDPIIFAKWCTTVGSLQVLPCSHNLMFLWVLRNQSDLICSNYRIGVNRGPAMVIAYLMRFVYITQFIRTSPNIHSCQELRIYFSNV